MRVDTFLTNSGERWQWSLYLNKLTPSTRVRTCPLLISKTDVSETRSGKVRAVCLSAASKHDIVSNRHVIRLHLISLPAGATEKTWHYTMAGTGLMRQAVAFE